MRIRIVTCIVALLLSLLATGCGGTKEVRNMPADIFPPTSPSNLSATGATPPHIDLAWSASTDNVGVTGYKIYRNGSYLMTVATTSVSDLGLTEATRYCYKVSAIDAASNESGQSSQACATIPDTVSPNAPPNLTAVAASSAQINLSWAPSSDNIGVTGYKVYRNSIYLRTVTSNPISDTDLNAATTYCYIIYAIDAAQNESSQSNQACATTDSPVGVVHVPDTGQISKYTANFGEDADYLTNPLYYTDNGDGTILDNITGLMWQKQDDATTRNWQGAVTYCSTLTLGGYSDWRLPTDFELLTIIDYGQYSPAIHAYYFLYTQSDFYWSSVVSASGTPASWAVSFSGGQVFGFQNDTFGYHYYSRCVRSSNAVVGDFIDNGNGTVTDKVTNLMWQKQDDGATHTWEQALSYCEGLTLAEFSDWRLPNIKALKTIADMTRYNPAINSVYFPSTQVSQYWSSTTATGNSTYAWFVNFNYGIVLNDNKTNAYYVRCIR